MEGEGVEEHERGSSREVLTFVPLLSLFFLYPFLFPLKILSFLAAMWRANQCLGARTGKGDQKLQAWTIDSTAGTRSLGHIITKEQGEKSKKPEKHWIVDCVSMMRSSSRIYFTGYCSCFIGSSAVLIKEIGSCWCGIFSLERNFKRLCEGRLGDDLDRVCFQTQSSVWCSQF